MDFGMEITAALASQLGQQRFELWFSDVAFEHIENCVRIATRSAFLLERLKKDFHQHIKEATQALGLHEISLEFVVDTQAVDRVVNNTRNATPQTNDEDSDSTDTAGADQEAKSVNAVSTNGASTSTGIPSSNAPESATLESPKRGLLRAASKPARGRRFRSLEAFVGGECNHLARTATEMVLKQPGEINPLLLHGPTGVGKTHLVEGIWSETRKKRRARIVYLSAEQFTTYFLEALRGDGLPNFRRKYRQADVLIIDDIQFFQGKQATLVELAYTIDELSRENRQLILTADRPPAQLARCVGQDIANRIQGGLVCAMKSIDTETMETISQRWAVERHLDMDSEIHKLIASRAQGDARQLAGVLNRLRAATLALQERVSLRLVNEVMYELLPARSRVIRLKDIRKAVCEMFGLEADALEQKSRSKAISQPRMVAMYLSKQHTTAGLHEISEFYGRRSHSSAVTAHNTVQEWIESAKALQINGQLCDVRDIISQLEQQLRAG